jgi:hypothetical protein
MDPATRTRLDRFGAWSGAIYMGLLGLGWVLVAGFIPPPSPAAPAGEIAALFAEDTLRIRVGMVLVMVAALFMIPITAAVAKALAAVEGAPGILSFSALLGGAGNMCLTFYPATLWLWAAYRPERPAELTYLINDLAWLQFVGGLTMLLGLPLSMAAAAFLDKRPDPVFPRWVGYLSLWAVLLWTPGELLFFFHSGPFAWNGLFALYIPVVAFGMWMSVTVWMLLRAARRAPDGVLERPIAGKAA